MVRVEVVEALVEAAMAGMETAVKGRGASGSEVYSAILTLAMRGLKAAVLDAPSPEQIESLRAAVQRLWAEVAETRVM